MAASSSISTQLLAFFLPLTVIYYGFKYYLDNAAFKMVLTFIYFLAIVVGMFFFNMSMTKELCGSTQSGTAILITSVPWLMIFGVMMIMLRIFPGWLAPFSNTFGYFIVWSMGSIDKVMSEVIGDKNTTDSDSLEKKQASFAIEQIYNDKSLIINQLSEDNFDNFWERSKKSGILSPNAEDFREELRKLIKLKNYVAEFCWAFLSGALAVAISHNYVTDSACERSEKEMIERMNQYEEEQKENSVPAPTTQYVS